jgi:putative membrane protein
MKIQNRKDVNTHRNLLTRTRNAIISASTLLLIGGCAGAYSDIKSETKPDTLTDANIAAIVVGANKIDISAGNIALKRSNNPEVKAFAQRMITDHNAVLNSAVELVTRLGVTPVNNDLVATLAKQSSEHEEKLKTLSGRAFDKAYIDHEVAYHEAVISVIEDQLIPGAHNAELKQTLVSVVPAFKAHLKHCQMIQKKI